jgi:hypothetical protein
VLCSPVSSFPFVSWSHVGSQFPTLDRQGSGFSQPSVVRYAVLFPTSCVMLCTLPKRDAPACLECLGSAPSITQKLGVIFPVRLLLSNTRIGKRPLNTHGATLRARTRQYSSALVSPGVDKGFDPVNRNPRSLRGQCQVNGSSVGGNRFSLLGGANDQPPIHSPRAEVSFETPCRVGFVVCSLHVHGARRACTVTRRVIYGCVQNCRAPPPRGMGPRSRAARTD